MFSFWLLVEWFGSIEITQYSLFLYWLKPLPEHLLGFKHITQVLEGSDKDTELFIFR